MFHISHPKSRLQSINSTAPLLLGSSISWLVCNRGNSIDVGQTPSSITKCIFRVFTILYIKTLLVPPCLSSIASSDNFTKSLPTQLDLRHTRFTIHTLNTALCSCNGIILPFLILILAKMKGITTLILLLAATTSSLVSAIKVPTTLRDGVYEISTRKAVRAKPYYIAHYDMEMYQTVNLTAKKNDDRGPLVSTRHRCSKVAAGHDSGNVTSARAMLSNWCAMYMPHGKSVVVAVQGNDVWYMCTYKRKHKDRSPLLLPIPQSCAREEIDMVSNRFDRWCGENKIAAVDIDDWSLTYGRTQREVSFCRQQKFRGTWLDRKHHGFKSGPGPEEDGPEKEEE